MNYPAIPIRTSSKKAVMLPDRYINLMPAKSQSDLRARQHRAASIASRITDSNTIADFFNNRTALLGERVGFHQAYEKHIAEMLKDGAISNAEYQDAMDSFAKQLDEALGELRMLKRGRHALEEDLSEMEQEAKRQRTRESLWDELKRLTHAYSTSMIWRVMMYGRNERKGGHVHYRNRIITHLNASHPERKDELWCHLTGFHMSEQIRAAHLVPKTLQDVELAELFGIEVDVMRDPRNGITLHQRIERGMDNGVVTIMPITTESDTSTRWICHVVKRSMLGLDVMNDHNGNYIKWKDLDKKELTFRSENRPARRYLYFRFIITYICAKRDGNVDWAEDIEERKVLWATPGNYLRKSMLRALARNISGVDLPDFLSDKTFEPEDGTEDSVLKFCNDVRRAIIESDKRAELEAKRKVGELSETSSDDDEIDMDEDSNNDDEF